MKVAVLSESPADAAAVRILIEGILGRQTQAIAPLPQVRRGGWSEVLRITPSVLKYLYYRTDADACAIVLDADDSLLHTAAHELPGGANDHCRLCELRRMVTETQRQLPPGARGFPLQTAIGIAMPAIEAWYRCDLDPSISEITYHQHPRGHFGVEARKRLKHDVYGTERPPLAVEMERASTAAQRLQQNLSLLETLFPTGFGSLARDVRHWTRR